MISRIFRTTLRDEANIHSTRCISDSKVPDSQGHWESQDFRLGHNRIFDVGLARSSLVLVGLVLIEDSPAGSRPPLCGERSPHATASARRSSLQQPIRRAYFNHSTLSPVS